MKVQSVELSQSYRDHLLSFASEIEHSQTDNFVSLLHAYSTKTKQTDDGELNTPPPQNGELNTPPAQSDHSTDENFYTRASQVDTSAGDLVKKIAKNEGYDLYYDQDDTREKVWQVYNKLKASVFAALTKTDEQLRLQRDAELKQDIERFLRGDDKEAKEYQNKVKELLASQEVNNELKDFFVGKHENFPAREDDEIKQKVWKVYHKLTRSVLLPEDKSDARIALMQDIEQKLKAKEDKYLKNVAALLASSEIDDNLAKDFAEAHHKTEERKKYLEKKEDDKVILRDKVMDVYNLLKASVFEVSDDPDEQSALQWEIERRLLGTSHVDRLYQREVAALLASEKDTHRSNKDYLNKPLQKAKAYVEAAFTSTKGKQTDDSSPKDDPPIQLTEIISTPKHLHASTPQDGALNDNTIDTSTSSDNDLTITVAPLDATTEDTTTSSDKNAVPITPLSDNHVVTTTASSDNSTNKPPQEIDQELKWYFTDMHSKYKERYTFIKIKEDEKRSSYQKYFYKRYFYRVKDQYKRAELKEKYQQRVSYEQAIESLNRDLQKQVTYLQRQFASKSKDEKIAIFENVLQGIVHLEAKYLTAIVKARASSRVDQIESEKLNTISSLLHSTPVAIWSGMVTGVGTNAIGSYLGSKIIDTHS